ncbi:ABC transporter substrate-binding protein [Cupriavidus basilensis]
MTDENRKFGKESAAANNGKFPTMAQAGTYSAVIHYLKAVAAMKADGDGAAVVAKMKAMPTDDKLFGKGSDSRRRPQDPPALSVRGEEAVRNRSTRATSTSSLPPFPPTRRSGRWKRRLPVSLGRRRHEDHRTHS